MKPAMTETITDADGTILIRSEFKVWEACPHCGLLHNPEDAVIVTDGTHAFECLACGKPFKVRWELRFRGGSPQAVTRAH